ncbi:MAG: FAD-binding oxidoreductase [Solirubrobacteraceae bacterium]
MDLRRALAEVVGDAHAFDDPELTAGYETDWTGRWSGRASVVIRPADTSEVARVVAVCAAEGAALVPQGGNSGLVGGGIPRDSVLLSLTRLRDVGPHDSALRTVSVGAGATLASLHDAVPDPGLDFGARDSATIGGIVACDAGGARALRHGTARARVAGLEAVLADGSVVSRMSGLLKDNAGYNLPALLVGSEGTLGVITSVLWKTVPRLSERVAALLAVDDVAEVLAHLRTPSLEACDFFTRACVPEAPGELNVIAEWAADHDPLDEIAAALGDHEALIADDTASRERLWAMREGIPERIQKLGVPVKLDVGVPLASLGRFLTAAPEACGSATPYLFGHLGDGNVHVNLVGDGADSDSVLALVLELGGTISAEHGVGVAKAAWLERARGQAEVAAMRAIKRGLDPAGILNPGVVLCD